MFSFTTGGRGRRGRGRGRAVYFSSILTHTHTHNTHRERKRERDPIAISEEDGVLYKSFTSSRLLGASEKQIHQMRLKSGRSSPTRESSENTNNNNSGGENRDEEMMNASNPGRKTSSSNAKNETKEGTVEDDVLEKHHRREQQQQHEQQQRNDLSSPPAATTTTTTKGGDENEKPTNKTNDMSRARRKRNEAVAVVSELYRLHEVGKKTDFRVTQEGLYQTMVELVNNISARVEKSNMVQMWVPRIAGKSVVMTTHGELCKISAKKKTHDSVLAKKFTENTTAFFFNCEVTNKEGMLGLPGRCYVLSRPEFTPSVTSYRPMEYVRVACAYECRIHTTMCLPVFLSEEAMKNERPFTILEVALCHMTESIGELYAATAHEFMKLGLFTTGHDRVGPERYMRKFIESTVETLAPGHANALGLMCETLNVPFAQFWIESNGLIVTAGCPYFVKEKECQSYRDMSSQISLMVGQGPVGQALSKETLIWVDDVQKASQIEWPLHHTSILLGLRGLCACKMRIDCVLPDGTKKKTDAILEILLNPRLQTSAEQIQTVEEVWSYLQRGVRVDNTKNAPDGASAPAVPDSPLAATAGVRGTDASASMMMELPDLTGKNNTDTTREGKNNDDETGKGKGTAPMTTLQAVEHISMVNKNQEEKNKSAPWGITLELLQTQFSKHLKDAATDLGVGSTTLKRICRLYGIGRWPRRSLKSKQYKAMKEAVKQQNSQNKLRKARSSGGHSSGGTPRDGGSSFKSPGGNSDAVAGESVHGPGGRMSGGGSLSNLAKTGDGSPLGDGLFTMGSTGGAPIGGKEGSGGVGALLGSGEEGRSHGGFQAFRSIATQDQFDWDDEEERERGASWHAGSGFVSHGRLKNAKGQIVASGSQHGGHNASQFFGAQQHQQPHQSMLIAPAMQQGDFGLGPAAEKAETKTPNNKYKKDVAVGTKAGAGKAAVPFSFDDHFYETVHGAHNFSQQLYPHQYNNNDDSVHGSTYSESAHGGSHYNGGSVHGNPGGDHSVHGTTALAGILNNTLGGGFDDDLFIANDTMEEADADMMAILLNEGEKVEEVPQLVVKFRVGADTIRFRLLHKWSVQMLLDRIRKLIVFPDSAKLKYMDDEDDMCILQSEHDLDECIKFTEHRKKESGNSGNNKSATNDPVVIGENNAQNNAWQQQQQQQQKQELLATGFAPNKPNGGEITIFICLADGSMPSLNAYELIKQDIHSIPPSLSASVNARRDQLTINVKVTHDNDTCRFLLEPKMNHVTLMEHVLKLFGIQKESSSSSHYHRLTYLDDSEEWITLAGDLDLDECRALCGCSPSLRMKLLDR